MSAKERVNDYKSLIESFLEGRVSASHFESAFLDMFKKEQVRLPERDFLVLDSLFADLDAFCADPELRDPDDLNEQELRSSAATALAKLEASSE